MSTFKKSVVVMLSTNEKAKVHSIVKRDYVDKLAIVNVFTISDPNMDLYEPQHLYFLSNEDIKEGDWFYNTLEYYVIKANVNSDHKIYFDHIKKIIASTDSSLNLPSPSQGFIQSYIESYNDGNPITEVMVEWNDEIEEWSEILGAYTIPASIKVNPKDNTITIRKLKDSWTREEVEALCLKLVQDEVEVGHDSLDFDNWITNNL